MRQRGENRSAQPITMEVYGLEVRPSDESVAAMRGNAEPIGPFAAEDAARERAMRRMRPMVADGRVSAPWDPRLDEAVA